VEQERENVHGANIKVYVSEGDGEESVYLFAGPHGYVYTYTTPETVRVSTRVLPW
jgi:hypothetical protein